MDKIIPWGRGGNGTPFNSPRRDSWEKSQWEGSAGMRGLLQRNLCQVRTAWPSRFSGALMLLWWCVWQARLQAPCTLLAIVTPASSRGLAHCGYLVVLGEKKSISPTPLSYLYLIFRPWCHMLEALPWVLLVSQYINLTFIKGCMPTQR